MVLWSDAIEVSALGKRMASILDNSQPWGSELIREISPGSAPSPNLLVAMKGASMCMYCFVTDFSS